MLMSPRRALLLGALLFLLIRFADFRVTLYQNAGYAALNITRAKEPTRQTALSPDYSLAISFFRAASNVTTTSVRGLGLALLYQGEEEAALQTWATMPIAMQDELVSRGNLALDAAQYQMAIDWYERALFLNYGQVICPLSHRLGKAYELAGQPTLARQQFLRCAQSGELYVDAYVALCFSYVNAGEVDEAVALFASLDELSRQDSLLLTCIGVGSMGENDYAKALTYFKEAVDVDPERASLYQWLSLTYTRLGMFAEAIESAQQATARDGSKIDYWQHLANLYRETGQDEAATAVLQKINTLEQMENNKP